MDDTDRELLELAARAAEIRWNDWTPDISSLSRAPWMNWPYDWNPLINNDDAFRLMVKLNIEVVPQKVWVWASHPGLHPIIKEPPSDNPCAATRRAITRAAAELGKALKETAP